MREFASGATRDSDENKPDYEGFLSPLVVLRFGEYMAKHRVQADGNLRDSDNWQKGMPLDCYIKSLWRHFLDLWLHHRDYHELARDVIEETLCAIIFNAQGYLHEHLKARYEEQTNPQLQELASAYSDLEAITDAAVMANAETRWQIIPSVTVTPSQSDEPTCLNCYNRIQPDGCKRCRMDEHGKPTQWTPMHPWGAPNA